MRERRRKIAHAGNEGVERIELLLMLVSIFSFRG